MTSQLPANENKTRDILVELSAARRADAAAREAQLPYRQLLRQIAETPEPKDFAAAFRARKGAPRIIAELKKASPSEGLIRADFQPEELAIRAAQAAGADGFLVGTALMRAERPGEKLKELMGCIDDGEQI